MYGVATCEEDGAAVQMVTPELRSWIQAVIMEDEVKVNPNTEGVPDPHLSEGGGLIQPPPGKCSINGPNELK